jgi:hypothetical protein
MTPPARRQKPTSADETARVLRILDMLREEAAARGLHTGHDTLITIADRIASRTED